MFEVGVGAKLCSLMGEAGMGCWVVGPAKGRLGRCCCWGWGCCCCWGAGGAAIYPADAGAGAVGRGHKPLSESCSTLVSPAEGEHRQSGARVCTRAHAWDACAHAVQACKHGVRVGSACACAGCVCVRARRVLVRAFEGCVAHTLRCSHDRLPLIATAHLTWLVWAA